MKKYITPPFLAILLISASCGRSDSSKTSTSQKKVEMTTNKGSIIILLYDETPLHRDNFLKLVQEQFYDSILFHRVIENFVIQAGDPASKKAEEGVALGGTDLPYTVPAEFDSVAFHKRGAVGAARDNRPDRASSSTQFYISQGRMFNGSRSLSDSIISHYEDRISAMTEMTKMQNDSGHAAAFRRLNRMYGDGTHPDTARVLYESLLSIANKRLDGKERYKIPEWRKEIYRTIGGIPHLDENYTVFGEVIQGMEVVDEIASTATDERDRPLEAVRILEMKVIN